MTSATIPSLATYTDDQIKANRKRYLASLRRSKHQCQVQLFAGPSCCAVGVAVRVLLGIRNEAEFRAAVSQQGSMFDPYKQVADLLGMESRDLDFRDRLNINDIWKMNDRDGMSFRQIADALAAEWGL